MDDDEAVHGLMDALLPGGDGFPAASATGMGTTLAARLLQADAELPRRLAAFVAARPAAAWHETAARLEAVEPKLFVELRKYAYLTYYEQEPVIEAIRALGFRYNDRPLPEGYPGEPFDRSRDAPRHERGRWVPTGEVRRVNLDGLGPDILGLEETR